MKGFKSHGLPWDLKPLLAATLGNASADARISLAILARKKRPELACGELVESVEGRFYFERNGHAAW